MPQLDAILSAIDGNLEAALERWFGLLRIPSVSTDPAHKEDCQRAARYMAEMLSDMGLEASVRETPGHPMVVAHARADDPGAPRYLFYGHYDVQPADPLEEWNTPPFEPVMVTGEDGEKRVFARGADDDKGQLLTFIEALRAHIEASGGQPLNLTILLEGEEESGSPSLDAFLRENADELRADMALVCDIPQWDAETPAITTRLRGMMHDEAIITGPRADLHSGLYGGPAHNPNHIVARLIAGLWDEDGRVTLEGFYDGVPELPESLRKAWAELGMTDEKFMAETGLRPPCAGEKGYSALEKVWARPTIEVNGMAGGYTGPGAKTVIPSRAFFKISCRLVGDQDPFRIREAFRAYVRANVPDGVQVAFSEEGGASPAVQVPEDSPAIRAAARCLAEEWGRQPVMMGSGGSIPVVRSFKDILGMDSLLVGFGLNEDAIHSPNEKYDLRSFHKGMRSWARIIAALGEGAQD